MMKLIDKRHKKSKKGLYIFFGILLVLSVIVYGLADRYLIRHVQEEVAVDPYNTTLDLSDDSTAASENVSDNGASSEDAADTEVDDWHYESDEVSITIEQVEKGSGENKITYYTADVVVKNADDVKSAFADNAFGRNIIEYTSTIAEDNDAVFAINGDYYGFRKDGIVIRNGVIYRDEPARTGLALYSDGSMKIYDETETTAQELLDAGVINTYSFGPALVTDGVAVDDFENVEIDTNFGNRDIDGSNPRTGIGLIDENHFLFIVVDGRSTGYSKGMTLDEFAKLFASYGCTQAYNLDGGGSSTMYFSGRVVNNPLGKGKERGTSDIIFIKGE